MEPSGNAKAAATDSRSGVSGLISSRAGTAQRIADLNFKNMPDGRVTQRGGFVHSWRRRLHRTRPTRTGTHSSRGYSVSSPSSSARSSFRRSRCSSLAKTNLAR